MSIKNVRGFVDNLGNAQLCLEDVARGLGFTQTKGTKEYIRWETIGSYLVDFGFSQQGGKDLPEFIPENIFYRLAFKAKNKTAEDFQSLVCDEILPTIRKTGKYETAEYLAIQETQRLVTELLASNKQDKETIALLSADMASVKSSLIFKAYTDPHARFTALQVRYFIHLGQKVFARNFYNSLQDYFGVIIPKGDDLVGMYVYEYILAKINIDDIDDFVCGIEQGNIVRSQAGHWTSLCGYTTNNIEYQRTLRNFNGCCAYCGSSHDIVAEHIIPKSIMAQFNPEKVNMIFNVVPACKSCNESKYTYDVSLWYPKQPSYSSARAKKIKEHITAYRI